MPIIHLLGTPRTVVNGVLTELTPSKPTLLLLFLALRQEWVTRDELAERLFPEVDQAQARANLRVSLLRASGLSWARGIEAERSRIRFRAKTDVEQFKQAIAQEKPGEAAALYQPLMAGFPLESVPDLASFFEDERRHLQELYVLALNGQAARLRAQGQLSAALELLERSLETEPLGEETLQTALALCLQLYDRERGIKRYSQFCRVLQAEAGVEPLPATQALFSALSSVETAASQLALPGALRSAELFIGREAEVSQLQHALPGKVFLSGEAGMGKTTLLGRAFPQVPMLACQEGLKHVPYHPLVTFLRLRPPPALGPYDEDLARLLPDLYPQLQPAVFDPQIGKLRLLEALTRAVNQVGHVLLVDDVQWADPATLEWLAFLRDRQDVSLVMAYRTEEKRPELSQLLLQFQERATVLRLTPLGAEGLAEWLRQLTGQQDKPLRFAGWLARHSGGNPLYALETMRSLFEVGLIREDDSGWHTEFDHLTRDYEELPPPPKLQALIRQRTGRLSPQAKQLLAAFSLHPAASLEFLAELLKLSLLEILDLVEEAEAAAFLKEGQFAHDLLRQGVSFSLSDLRRKHLHLQIAELLEQQTAESSVLAWHWQQGGHPQRAWPARFQHAKQLAQRGQYEVAVQQWQTLLGELPPGHALELPTRIKLGRSLFWQDIQEGGRQLQNALDLIEWGQDGPADLLKVEALTHLAEIKVYQGQGEQAEKLLDEAVALAQCLSKLPEELRRSLIEQRVEVGFRRGQYARMRELMKAQPNPWPMLETLMALGEYFAGNFRHCVEEMQRLLQTYPELRHHNAMEADIGLCYLVMGELQQSREVLEVGLKRDDQGPHMQVLMRTHLGMVSLLQGNMAESESHLQLAEQAAQELGAITYLADVKYRQAVMALLRGQMQQALDLSREAREYVLAAEDPFRLLYITSSYAAMLALKGDTAQAAALLKTCQLQEDTPPQARNHYHIAYAQLYLSLGQLKKAQVHLDQEKTLAERYGMVRLVMLTSFQAIPAALQHRPA